jgi:hypothetical protein
MTTWKSLHAVGNYVKGIGGLNPGESMQLLDWFSG